MLSAASVYKPHPLRDVGPFATGSSGLLGAFAPNLGNGGGLFARRYVRGRRSAARSEKICAQQSSRGERLRAGLGYDVRPARITSRLLPFDFVNDAPLQRDLFRKRIFGQNLVREGLSGVPRARHKNGELRCTRRPRCLAHAKLAFHVHLGTVGREPSEVSGMLSDVSLGAAAVGLIIAASASGAEAFVGRGLLKAPFGAAPAAMCGYSCR